MTNIHPSAHIHPDAILDEGVSVGAGAVIGGGVRLGKSAEVGAHAVIEGQTEIAENCRFFPGAVVGMEAQTIGYSGAGGKIQIGAGTILREFVTIHKPMEEDGLTRIGADCYFMVYSHVGHDCTLGDRVIMANSVNLGGHVTVGNDANLSNYIGVHQFCRIGEGAMIVGPMGLRKDAPPFLMVDGIPSRVKGMNVVGLRRRGVSAEIRENIKRAYRIVYGSAGILAERIEQIEREIPLGRELQSMLEFLRSSERGILAGKV